MKLTLRRYEGNPVLKGVPGQAFHSKYIYNAAAAVHDEKIILVYRAEGDYERPVRSKWPLTMLGLAESADGFHFTTSPEPFMRPREMSEDWGIEDPRISKIGDTYYIVYVQVTGGSGRRDTVAFATTKDFRTVERKWQIMPTVNQRTTALFPEKFGDEFLLLHRVVPNISIARSADLRQWRDSRVIMAPRPGIAWEEKKIGICGPPIRTECGWLLIYHGRDACDVYRLGLAWLDLEDPSKVIGRLEYPILEPETAYEKAGLTANAVYSCGAVEWRGQYLVYYGAADSVLGMAWAPVDEVLASLQNAKSRL
jgi:predicted GH43/DUF377 family glycosyl hydrolase